MSALVDIARRSGMDAAAQAYDAGLTVPALAEPKPACDPEYSADLDMALTPFFPYMLASGDDTLAERYGQADTYYCAFGE